MSRKTITLEVDDDGQEALLRSYHAFVLEMSALAQSAPDGKVLDQLEEVAVEKGRETLRATLERTVQQRIEAAEKKGRRCGSVPVVRNAKTVASPHGPS
jgi:phage terminase Nu1 subunit (DNA packaging protein)